MSSLPTEEQTAIKTLFAVVFQLAQEEEKPLVWIGTTLARAVAKRYQPVDDSVLQCVIEEVGANLSKQRAKRVTVTFELFVKQPSLLELLKSSSLR